MSVGISVLANFNPAADNIQSGVYIVCNDEYTTSPRWWTHGKPGVVVPMQCERTTTGGV